MPGVRVRPDLPRSPANSKLRSWRWLKLGDEVRLCRAPFDQGPDVLRLPARKTQNVVEHGAVAARAGEVGHRRATDREHPADAVRVTPRKGYEIVESAQPADGGYDKSLSIIDHNAGNGILRSLRGMRLRPQTPRRVGA